MEDNMKKSKGFTSLFSALGSIGKGNQVISQTSIDDDLAECVKQAYEEWQSAENFFHSVSDPDLVDHAIYKLEASKARYTYLLKQAKQNRTRTDIY